MRTVGNVVSLIFLLLVVNITTLAGGAMAVGLGWVLSKVFPITVFQGSAIIAAVGLILAIYLSVGQVQESLSDIRNCLAPSRWDWLEDEDEDDEDEEYDDGEWDEEMDENGDAFDRGRGVPFANPVEARRNDPCPCGSGRKYKNCCGRGETN